MMFYEWQWRRSLSVGITPFSKAVQWIWLGSFSGRSVTPGPCVWHPLTLGSLLYKQSPVGAAVALHWPPFGLSCAQPSSVAVSPLTPRQHGNVVAGRQRQLAEDTLRSTSNRRRPPHCLRSPRLKTQRQHFLFSTGRETLKPVNKPCRWTRQPRGYKRHCGAESIYDLTETTKKKKQSVLSFFTLGGKDGIRPEKKLRGRGLRSDQRESFLVRVRTFSLWD